MVRNICINHLIYLSFLIESSSKATMYDDKKLQAICETSISRFNQTVNPASDHFQFLTVFFIKDEFCRRKNGRKIRRMRYLWKDKKNLKGSGAASATLSNGASVFVKGKVFIEQS